MSFNYIIEKIKDAPFETEPFKHLLINKFFKDEHFKQIITDTQIKRPIADNTRNLIDDLISNGYQIQPFAGSVMSVDDYIEFLDDRSKFNPKLLKGQGTSILSGYGMTMRLSDINSTFLAELYEFLNSNEFVSCLLEKFKIDGGVRVETAYQKNLTGYNLSPHPDMRDKALTYMANIYTEKESSKQNFHTHFMKFKPEYRYIYDFWKYNDNIERCWVPWEWCETYSLTSENNAISIFKPEHDTLHAVDINYDHLHEQRNQVYGNLWYQQPPDVFKSRFGQLNIAATHTQKSIEHSPVKELAKSILRKTGLRK